MTSDTRSEEGPAAAARDPDLFEEFYRRHFDAITRFVARRVTDPHTVADVTAEVFLAAIDSADSYRPGRGSETAWLYGIARNLVGAEARRTARQAALGARIAGRRLLEADDIARLEEQLDAEAAGRRALAALAGLPQGERALLELITVDQLTLPEAASALGLRQVTARVRLHRARKTLRGAARSVPDQPPPEPALARDALIAGTGERA
ncbi:MULTISPECIES: RNA polymerase sigma factor [unclassified Streptomyces]|uniref:RNA polymerase sigma factor n=1 Tax=unclassified Streptomyces TaxID=2593676 RepID=UPI00093B3D83|nr:sigma-70 family RNA polymerase sigma factor [Streptomyces sp. CB01249]OKJ01852.1 RNA polymerase subunit sigma [Streptomyces sp. CB01249]